MVGEYLIHFQTEEDKIESAAYMVYRRFQRLGLRTNPLGIKLAPGFLDDSSDEGDSTLDRAASHSEPIFRNFTSDEITLIQLGKLVPLKEGGLTEPYQYSYQSLRDKFLGAPLLLDYYDSLTGSAYDPTEVIWVAKEYGNF